MFQEEEPSTFAGFLIRINFDEDIILSECFWIFAQSEQYWNQAKLLVSGDGQPQFNANAVKQIKVPLPPLKTQLQIVARIEKEQALANANKELIKIFEQKIEDRIAKVWGTSTSSETQSSAGSVTPAKKEKVLNIAAES